MLVLRFQFNNKKIMSICGPEGNPSLRAFYVVPDVSQEMNLERSRAHLIVCILVESRSLTNGSVSSGKLNLVDLAASGRAAKTGAKDHQLKVCSDVFVRIINQNEMFHSLCAIQTEQADTCDEIQAAYFGF